MMYAIVETDSGLTVAEMKPGMSPEDAAARYGGAVVDPSPYPTYEEACDAVLTLKEDGEEDDDAD